MSKRKKASQVVRPRIYKDGKAWCALLGSNIQEGIAGFGKTPGKALKAFDRSYRIAADAQIRDAKADWDELGLHREPVEPSMEERLAKALEALRSHPVVAGMSAGIRDSSHSRSEPCPWINSGCLLEEWRELVEERRRRSRTPAQAMAEGLPKATVSPDARYVTSQEFGSANGASAWEQGISGAAVDPRAEE